MNSTLWVMQVILAAVFSASGIIVLIFRNKLKSKLTWLSEYSSTSVLLICLAKIVGAIGLILPILTGILPILTSISSFGIACIMALAFGYHIRHKEYKDVPATILFFSISIFIAINRF